MAKKFNTVWCKIRQNYGREDFSNTPYSEGGRSEQMDEFKRMLHDMVEKEYQNIRISNQKKHQQTIINIYAHIPRIKEIDETITKASLSVCSSVLNGGASAQSAVQKLQQVTAALTEEKNKLLQKFSIPADCLKEIHNCPLCKDKGYVNNKRCACYEEKFKRLMQKMSNVCATCNNCFEKFNLNLYSKEVNVKYGVSPYENMKNVLELATSYAQSNISQNLLFYGATGLGKTFTSDCIAKKYIEDGKTVFYMSAPKLFSTFEDYKFGRDVSGKNKQVISSVYDAQLLIIDDLGTEFRSTYVDSILFDIINSRLNNGANMIISTNLEPDQLAAAYSDRIASRIIGGFEKMPFFGEDIRLR